MGGKWPVAQDPQNITRAYLKDPDTGCGHILKWRYAGAYGTAMSDYRWRTARGLAAIKNGGRRPLDGMDVVAMAIHIRDKTLANGLLTAAQVSKDAALDGERTRMGVTIEERADGTVAAADQSQAEAEAEADIGSKVYGEVNDIWDAEPFRYPDPDADPDRHWEPRR
jgi:hypothetical protein